MNYVSVDRLSEEPRWLIIAPLDARSASALLDDLIVDRFADDLVELCSGTALCTIIAGYDDFGVAKMARTLSERAEGVFYAVQFLNEVDFPGFPWVFVAGRTQRDLDIDDLWQFCSELGCGRCAPL